MKTAFVKQSRLMNQSSKHNRITNLIPFLLIVALGLCVLGDQAKAEVLTLDQALSIAFDRSPDMQRVRNSLEASQENLKAQDASLKSQFSLTVNPYSSSRRTSYPDGALQSVVTTTSGSSVGLSIVQPIKWTDGTLTISENLSWNRYDRSGYDRQVTLSGDQDTVFHYPRDQRDDYSNELKISFDQPLFTYNQTMLRIKELELALENAQLNYSISRLQIESSVTSRFLNMHLALRSLEIAKTSLNNATESHEIIVSKVDAGLAAREELYQAELTKSNALADVQNQQTSFDNSLDEFKIVLGLPLDMELFLAADIRKMIVVVDREKALENAVVTSLELRKRDIDIQMGLHDIIRTEAMNEFKGSVRLEYGIKHLSTEFGDLYSSPEPTRSVGLTFNVPLYDWGQQKHLLAADEARLASTRLNASEYRKSIIKEVRAALRQLQNLELQIDIAEQNARNAQLTHDLNLERYRNGDLSSKDMAFYQTQLATQQLNEVQALKDYKLALLDIKILTMWDFEKNESIIVNRLGDNR